MYLVSPMGTAPGGTLKVKYLGSDGVLQRYLLEGPGYSKETYGTPLMGPAYINPLPLKRTTIISVPASGFKLAAYKKVGYTEVKLIYGNTVVEERLYDSRGTLVKSVIPMMGGYTVTELVR